MKRLWPILAFLALTASMWGQPPPRYAQRIGAELPLGTVWRDESGRAVPLSSCFGGRPVLLLFGYYNCPQLCSVLERSAVDTLRDLKAGVGKDFDVVYLSIDPSDTPVEAARKRADSVQAYGRGDTAAGWHYLTADAASIRAVAEAAGFGYRYDTRSRLYQHPSGFVVVTPGGKVSRYFLGVDFSAEEAAAAFHRAAEGKTGQPVFDLLLECFRGDAFTGRYGPLIWKSLEISVALTVALVFGGILWLLRKERA